MNDTNQDLRQPEPGDFPPTCATTTTEEVAPAPPPQPDWETIARTLWGKVYFAIQYLKSNGTGTLYDHKTGIVQHWKDDFADALELRPGFKIDREGMHAMGLPKKQRDKFFKDRAAAKEASK